MNAKRGLLGMAFAALTAAAASAAPTVQLITFDDYTTNSVAQITSGYANLGWLNLDAIVAADDNNILPGLNNAVVSTDYVAVNDSPSSTDIFGVPVSSAFGGRRFGLLDAYFGSGSLDGQQLTVYGFKQNGTLLIKQFAVDTLGPTLERFNWTNLIAVGLIGSGGTPDPVYGSPVPGFNQDFYSIDNLRIFTDVPEPGALVLIASAATGLAAVRRRRANV